MHKHVSRGVLVALAGLFLLTAARADEEKVPLDKVPRPVLDALKAKYPGAELVGVGKEIDNNETVYEAAIKYQGHKMDVTFKADGTLVSAEKEIDAKDLPKPVAGALEAKYPKATYQRVEEETEGTKVTYEIRLVTADRKTVSLEVDGCASFTWVGFRS
jgi:hypothetical protein